MADRKRRSIYTRPSTTRTGSRNFLKPHRPFIPVVLAKTSRVPGFTEEDLCIGDILAAGSVRLQVAQGRQPCWKLNLHTGNPAMAASFQKTGRTGWYFRVLETGKIVAGDDLRLVERPCPEWNLRDVILARFNPRLDPDIALALSRLDQLAEPWRASFAKKAGPGYQEDTSRRLKG